MITYRACLNHIKDALRSVTDEADIEAEILLFDTFQLTKSKFFLIQDNMISDMSLYNTVDTLLKERLTGKPLAYVLGYWDFFGSRYFVDPGVLVPRPETELLVEHALATLERLMSDYKQSDITVLELGVGTGIMSIEIAKRYPDCTFHGWDISDTAINLAKRNASHFLCNQIMFYHGDFFGDHAVYNDILMSEKPVLFLSNPPYIPTHDIATLDSVVKDFEPLEALDGGADGLDIYRQCLDLISKGHNMSFAFEIGVNQRLALSKECDLRNIRNYTFLKDLQDIDRVFATAL